MTVHNIHRPELVDGMDAADLNELTQWWLHFEDRNNNGVRSPFSHRPCDRDLASNGYSALPQDSSGILAREDLTQG